MFRVRLLLGFLFLILVLGRTPEVDAAPCCARSAAAPFLILGDDEAQFNFGLSFADTVAAANSNGSVYFNDPQDTDRASNLRLDGAVLLSDRFQAGASLVLVGRSVTSSAAEHSAWGLGDIRLSMGYEVLPSWTYSVWRPQGFVFSVLTLPVGRSLYEATPQSTPADYTGNGFYSASVGTLFTKRWSTWDAFLIGEMHYGLPRTFNAAAGLLTVRPGWGGSLGVGGGWSPGGGSLRLGLRAQPRMDQARSIEGLGPSPSSTAVISYCDTGFDLSYMLGGQDTFMLSYTDQTVLGSAVNTNLVRSVALNFQHRWER
jgi:hypothetical protein